MGIDKVVRSYLCAAASLAVCGAASTLASQAALGQEMYGSETGMVREIRDFRVQLPFDRVARAVTTEVVDGVVVYEGDIVLGTVAELERSAGVGSRAVVIDGARWRWPASKIPYVIPSNHSQKTRIEAAIQMVADTTNLCLFPLTTELDHIHFVDGSGCSSRIGRQGGGVGQSIIISGDCSVGSIAHEILHAAGLWHEQTREDRDKWITVRWENVAAGKEHNFDRHVSDGIDFGAYDYGSIMHYAATNFSKNGLPTIVVNAQPGKPVPTIGQRNRPSAGDIAAINAMYSGNTSSACR